MSFKPRQSRTNTRLPRPIQQGKSSPEFPGERLLSAEFSWKAGPNYPSIRSLRVAVSDGQGNAFDPIANHNAGFAGDWTGVLGRDLPKRSAPRQSSPLAAAAGSRNSSRIQNSQSSAGAIPNLGLLRSCRHRPPKMDWGLPVAKFAAYQTSPEVSAKHERYSRTECDFTLRENNRETVDWTPVVFEVSDATGNHWRAWPRDLLAGRTRAMCGKRLTVPSGPANRPGNFAWSSSERQVFRKASCCVFPRFGFQNVNALLEPQTTYEQNGVKVELAAVVRGRCPAGQSRESAG